MRSETFEQPQLDPANPVFFPPAADSADVATANAPTEGERAAADDHRDRTIAELTSHLELLRGRLEELERKGEDSAEESAPKAAGDSAGQSSPSHPRNVEDTPGSDQPVTGESEDDIFARLRGLSLLKAESSTSAPVEEPPAREPEVAPAAGPAAESTGEEESIEQYMARLLNRVRAGGPDAIAPKASQSSQEPSRSQPRRPRQGESPQAEEAKPVEAAKPTVAPAPAAPAVPKGPVEMIPRASAPEKNEMGRMRELANLQARAAITKHGQRRWALSALLKWSIAAIVNGASVAALVLVSSEDTVSRWIAIGGFAVGAYWVWLAVQATMPGFAAIKRVLVRRKDAEEATSTSERVAVATAKMPAPAKPSQA